MAVTDRVTDIVLPLLASMQLSLYDVELNGATLRVTIDGPEGVNMDDLARVTKALSRELDEVDPMPGKYTLEVSSPGLERRLRTAEHFIGAIDEQISVKLGPHVETQRRLSGVLTEVTDTHISLRDDDGVVEQVLIADITKAVTVLEWGPAPKPGQPGAKKRQDTADVLPNSSQSEPSDRRAAIK
jgi:ribosome maturation factor RimP